MLFSQVSYFPSKMFFRKTNQPFFDRERNIYFLILNLVQNLVEIFFLFLFIVPEANNEDGFEFIYFFWNEQILLRIMFLLLLCFLMVHGDFFMELILFAFLFSMNGKKWKINGKTL